MRANTFFRNKVALLALSALLTACGGGGSSSSANPGAGAGPIGEPAGRGTAVVSWDAPTTKEDGSCVSDLDSYRISYGLSPSVYGNEQMVDTSDLSCVDTGKTDACGKIRSCTYMVENLSAASWYFAVQALDSVGNESGYSNEGIKTVQ